MPQLTQNPKAMTALLGAEGHAVLHPQASAAGPHDRDLIAGGAIAGAALSVLERQAAPAGRLARATVDFIRPAPMEPLTVEIRCLRRGRRVRLDQARVTSSGADVAVISALWLTTGPAVSEHWPGDGTGLAATRLSDRDGMLGTAVQAQILRAGTGGPQELNPGRMVP
jgi:acyl-coenzyme A thioesterase PaaI-like protein